MWREPLDRLDRWVTRSPESRQRLRRVSERPFPWAVGTELYIAVGGGVIGGVGSGERGAIIGAVLAGVLMTVVMLRWARRMGRLVGADAEPPRRRRELT